MGKVFLLHAEQGGRELPIREDYDHVIWAGLSWAVGEVSEKDVRPGEPVKLTFTSTEMDPTHTERPTLPGALLGEGAIGPICEPTSGYLEVRRTPLFAA